MAEWPLLGTGYQSPNSRHRKGTRGGLKELKKKRKLELLRSLSGELESFSSDYNNHFMCPTCMDVIPLEESDRISVAHVLPQAAGGRDTTFLCRDCNSLFGQKQDKWFGELVRLLRAEQPSVLETSVKENWFEIDGLRVNGKWQTGADGGLEFFIFQNHNSPETLAKLDAAFADRPHELAMKLTIPLMKREHLISVGLMTAGYLAWFRFIGYAWVFQSHLDPVRSQILDPDAEAATGARVVSFDDFRADTWFGFIPIGPEHRLAFGVDSHFIVFPSHRGPEAAPIPNSLEIGRSDIKSLSKQPQIPYGVPTSLIYRDEVLILPDNVASLGERQRVLFFPDDQTPPQILRPASDAELEQLPEGRPVLRRKVRR